MRPTRRSSSSRVQSLIGTMAFVMVLACGFGSEAKAASLLIPIPNSALSSSDDTMKAPAIDLIDGSGRALDRDEVVDLIHSGKDVSLLDPRASDVWTPTSLPATNDERFGYPADGATLTYDSDLPNSEGMMRARVVAEDGRAFRLVVSLNSHASLIRAALLRRLGYTISSPRYYRSIRLRFKDLDQRNLYLDGVSYGNGGVAPARWLVSTPGAEPILELSDIVLEPGRIETPPYQWGAVSGSAIQGRRALRALIIPFVLADINESINLYSWEVGKILSNNVSLTHQYASNFADITFEDARWIVRKIAHLTRSDLAEIVAIGKYPEHVNAIVLEKMIARRDQLVSLFQLKYELPRGERKIDYNTKLTLPPDLDKGKVTQEHYEGYAGRYTIGDPNSPLRTGEITRYLTLQAMSAGIQALTTKINEQITIRSASDVVTDHQKSVIEQIIDHIRKNPKSPYEQSLGTWAGPTGGFRLNASRNLVTGTYYGSDSPLQLVDNVSAQANVGFFMGFDGVPTKLVPGVGGNLYVQRNYIHVRPIPNAKEALKTNWKWLWVPGFMKHLGKILEPGSKCPTSPSAPGPDTLTDGTDPCQMTPAEALSPEQVGKNLDAFLTEMKEGELFTITDTIGMGASGTLTIPLSALISGDISGISGSFAFGANGQTAILRRTTFTRTKDGLQVYTQSVRSGAQSFSFDFNFWMNIFHTAYTTRAGAATTHAYILGDKPSEADAQRKLLVTLQSLLKHNNTDSLEENYPSYLLKHKTPSHSTRAKLLRWSWDAVEENHRLTIQPPADPEGRYKPEEQQRTFYSNRIVRRSGTNDYAFLSDIIDGFFKGYGYDSSASGSNPADSFLGRSKWNATTSEAETTPGHESEIFTMVERHWQGWLLSQKKLFKIFDQIEARVQSLNLPTPLFQRDFFNNLKRLEMYDIQSSLLIYEPGVSKIRQEILAARGNSEQALVQKLIDLDGREAFRNWCRQEITIRDGGNSDYGTVDSKVDDVMSGRGWAYECLKPWMTKVIKMSKKYPTAKEEQVRWTNDLVRAIETGLEFGKFLNWLGKENFFFQVRVSGFRKGQEDGDNTNLSGQASGNPDYLSSTIGTVGDAGAGPLKDLATQTQITAYELYARYLSEAQ